MKRSNSRTLPTVPLVLALAAASMLAGPPQAAAQESGASGSWTIGERVVPAPAGASEELRAALAAIPAPDVAASQQRVPQSEEQWLAMQAGSANADLEQMAGAFGLSIEKDEIEGVPVYRVTPNKVDPRHTDHLFLHVHGGAYVLGGGDAAASEAALVAARAGIPAVSVDYRMPPKHSFPAAGGPDQDGGLPVHERRAGSRSGDLRRAPGGGRAAICRWPRPQGSAHLPCVRGLRGIPADVPEAATALNGAYSPRLAVNSRSPRGVIILPVIASPSTDAS